MGGCTAPNLLRLKSPEPTGKWKGGGGREVLLEEQACLCLLSSELGRAPAGWDVPISSTPSAHLWVKHCGAAQCLSPSQPGVSPQVSPFCQPQKAASIQSLHPRLGKARRASAYLLPQTTADR